MIIRWVIYRSVLCQKIEIFFSKITNISNIGGENGGSLKKTVYDVIRPSRDQKLNFYYPIISASRISFQRYMVCWGYSQPFALNKKKSNRKFWPMFHRVSSSPDELPEAVEGRVLRVTTANCLAHW